MFGKKLKEAGSLITSLFGGVGKLQYRLLQMAVGSLLVLLILCGMCGLYVLVSWAINILMATHQGQMILAGLVIFIIFR